LQESRDTCKNSALTRRPSNHTPQGLIAAFNA
jgi:hypothetical protein